MKKLLLSIPLLLGLYLSAQDIFISFNPNKAGVIIDSVWVTNQRTNQKVKLNQTEPLLLTQPQTGIPYLKEDFNLGYVYPNPCNGESNLIFSTAHQEKVRIAVYNATGQLLIQKTEKLVTGIHKFQVSFPLNGIYHINVIKSNEEVNFKVSCTTGKMQSCNIHYTGFEKFGYDNSVAQLKSASAVKTMYFLPGDLLHNSAFSGKNNTIIMDSPALSKVYSVEFFDCIDFEKQSYPIVKIGNQWWMAKNLQSTKYSDGTTIANISDNTLWTGLTTGAYCLYNNLAGNKNTFGALYNWLAVNNSKLCPTGWHLPNSSEWTALETILGGTTMAGGKMKLITGWNSPNFGATNSSGFSALPGGCRTSEGFYDNGIAGYWWSSSEVSGTNASRLKLIHNLASLNRNNQPKINGYSVRCIKNEQNQVTHPSVTTLPVTGTTLTTALCGGNVISDGGATVTSRGVCWSTSPNPTVFNDKTIDGAGTGTFTSLITGLTPNTTYYIKAYAVNSIGTAYGNQVQVKTNLIISSPTVNTTPVTSIKSNTAASGGEVISDGGVPVTTRGVCWSTSPEPTTADSKTSNGTGMGSFVSNITGLTASTTYYVRAYATNNIGTAYGSQVHFTTGQLINLPTVNTGTVASITSTSAVTGGHVAADGGAAVTSRGVCWRTSPNPTVANSKTTNGSGTGSFTSNLTGLTPNTIYYVRAYATNSSGTAYGNQVQFKTNQVILVPTVNTNAITSITQTTALSGGHVTSDGGATVTARGICWSASPNPTIASNKTANGTGTGNFTSNITGLTANTTYYVRAYATNSAGTAYGNMLQFTTHQVIRIPTVTTAIVSNITTTSATSGGNITSDGGAAVTSRGVCWSTSPNPTITSSKTSNGTGTGNFTSNLTGLTANTTYYARAYATNSAGTAYGSLVQFTTSHVITTPTVTTAAVTAITQSAATSGGNVITDGGAVVTARGICWSTSPNPSIAGNKTSNGTGTGSFTSNLTGLAPNTTYYVRAYATNSAGTKYGNQVQFTTSLIISAPTVITAPVSVVTQTSATTGGIIISDGGAPVTARGVCWSTSPGPTISGSKTNNGTGPGVFTSTITGLTPDTTYYVRAYATTGIGTSYGDEIIFTTLK